MKSCSTPPLRIGRAFTLVELLVVIVIIAILAALSIPVVTIAVAKMHAVQTQSTMHDLAAAVGRYRTEYNRFPIDPSQIANAGDEDIPAFQTDGSVTMITILTARTDPNALPNLNSKQISFLHVPLARNGLNGIVDKSDGEADGSPLQLVDLWGQPFFVLLDTNNDNRIKNPDTDNGDMIIRHNPKYLSGSAIIYSAGPDKIPNTKDDICSWR